MPELGIGTIFAGHRIEEVAGRGGMGIVYKATHLALDVTVALKVIAPEYASDDGFRERFKSESRVAAAIEHPNVVQVRDAGEQDGQLYITMRYVPGTDLRTMIRDRGRLEPRVAAAVISQVASALDAAHARGLVHRDVKPGNVLIEERGSSLTAYLGDFGLTRQALTRGGGLTKTGTWVGTLDYVAPEQIEGKQIDARADVYALGCVLCEALTGTVPYPHESDVATMFAHINEPAPKLVERVAELPPQLDKVVDRAMAKKPDDRYRSAGDLGRAAVAAAEGRVAEEPEQSVATGKAAAGEEVPVAGETALAAPDVTVTSAPVPETPAREPAPRTAPPHPGRHAPATDGPGVWRKRARGALPGGRRLPIGVAVIGLAALAAGALAIAGVFGGGADKRDFAAEARRIATRFEEAFRSEDLDRMKAVLTSDARYYYLGDNPRSAAKHYKDVFDGFKITSYSLDVSSIRPETTAGATARLTYSFRDPDPGYCPLYSGELELRMRTQGTAKGPLRINEVDAIPDLVNCFEFADPPASGDYTVRLDGIVVAEASETVNSTRNTPIRMPLNTVGRERVTEDSKLRGVASGRERSGPFRTTFTAILPETS